MLILTPEFFSLSDSLMRCALSGGFRYNTYICSNSNIHPSDRISPTSSSCSILCCSGKNTVITITLLNMKREFHCI